jgi:hypothetical protein
MLEWLARMFGVQAPARQPQADPGASEIPPGAYVIGRTKDLVKQQHLVAPDDPRRSLFVYHELREEEEMHWSRNGPRRILASEDPDGPDHLAEGIQQLSHAYSPPEMRDLVDIKPCAGDSNVADLCREYRVGTRAARSFIRSEIDSECAWTLLTFSKRSAVLAVRKEEPGLIWDSLIAHAIEDLAAGDVRDNLVALGLVFHCAQAVLDEPAKVLNEVGEMAGPSIAQLLRDFVRRQDLEHILSAMGWKELMSEQGVGYRWVI